MCRVAFRPRHLAGGLLLGMETPGVLLESILLENGYRASFYDQSRPIAGDRCMVQLLLDIPIPLQPSHFEHLPNSKETSELFMSQSGSELHYHFKKVRHFVPEPEKLEVLSQLKLELTETVFRYIQHPDFGPNYILKVYQEWLSNQRCFRAHSEAIERAEERDA
jgi:hypothetical protein